MQRNKLNFIGRKVDGETLKQIKKLKYAYDDLEKMQQRFHSSDRYYHRHSLAQIATAKEKDLIHFNVDRKPTIQILPQDYKVSYEDLIAKPRPFTKDSIRSSTLTKRVKIVKTAVQHLMKELLEQKRNILTNSLADERDVAGGPSGYDAQEENLARALTILFFLPIRYPQEGFDVIGKVFRLDNIHFLKEGTLEPLGNPLSVVFSAEPDFRRFNENEKSKIHSIVRSPKSLDKEEKLLREKESASELEQNDKLRDEYVSSVAQRIRLVYEHKLFLQEKTSEKFILIDGARGSGAFEGNPLLILTIMRAVLDNEDRYKQHMVDDYIAITSIITSVAPLALYELANAIWLCEDPDILNEIIEKAPIHLPFYYKEQYHAKRYFLEDPLFQKFRDIMQKSPYQLLMPTQEELAIIEESKAVISKKPPEDKSFILPGLKQEFVVDKSAVDKKEEMKISSNLYLSQDKLGIVAELEKILASDKSAAAKKEKIKKYIYQINQNPNLVFRITADTIEKIDLFFTKQKVCDLMTDRNRFSEYFSKTPKGHEGDTSRQIRSFLDNLRLIVFSKSGHLDEKTVIGLMSTRVYSSGGKAKIMNPHDEHVYQMYHLVITPGIPGERSAQEVAVQIKLFLLQLLKDKKLDQPDGTALVVTFTNNEYQKNYPVGSYFIRLYLNQYEVFSAWADTIKEFSKDRFPKNPQPDKVPPIISQAEQKASLLSLGVKEEVQIVLPSSENKPELKEEVSAEKRAEQIKMGDMPGLLASQPEKEPKSQPKEVPGSNIPKDTSEAERRLQLR